MIRHCAYCGLEVEDTEALVIHVGRSETFEVSSPALLAGKVAGRVAVSGPEFRGRGAVLAWHPFPSCAWTDGMVPLFGNPEANLDALVKRAAKRGYGRVEIL